MTNHWSGLGDIRVKGVYTGLTDDMSTGLTFGLKLPTGDFSHEDARHSIDRDSEIGTGSTDALLGIYHRGNFGDESDWSWFAQAQTDLPMLAVDGYRRGFQFDTSARASYHGFKIGELGISPIAQIIGNIKTRDQGAAAAPDGASGYERVMIAPALEFSYDRFVAYGEVDVRCSTTSTATSSRRRPSSS